MDMKQILKNKTALITGGYKGIGLGIAECLLQEGMKVAITGRNEQSIKKTAADLKEKYGAGNVLFFTNDVRDFSSLENLTEEIVKAWNKLDVVVANAGIGHFESIDNMSHAQWDETIDVNLKGVFNTVKATIPALKKSKGYIITIGSLAGSNFFAKGAAYNASKFGLLGFSQAIMLDLRSYGIKVSTIMPGSVTSNFNNHQPSEADAWKIQPEDLGQIVADLLKIHPRTLPSRIEVRPSIPK
jgi:3-oxoacyl-[acyl-carrier protein] reductase